MSTVPSLVLFEHASGYGLFRVKEFEEVSALEAEVEASANNVSAFNSVVSLAAFLPFKSAVDALTNANSISEGIPTDDLRNFISTNLPKKLKKFVLGVSDPKLGGALSEQLNGLKVSHIGVVPEILRGIRTHFAKLVKGLTEKNSSKAQLGLGHSYSRAKVKFNVNKSDNMIIQSIALLDQLDKDVNLFAMRIREWYSYHFPELVKIVNDNYMFAKCVKLLKNRKEMLEKENEAEIISKLEEIVMDSAKARAVYDASKSSMGMDVSAVDLLNIDMFATRVIALADYRKMVSTYLQDKMASVAPNLATLIGETVGARLISHAGSLTNLAKYPASTVQILGAEKALFRALKTKGNTPKYGLIFHSSFIGRAGSKNKGRISRFLANKCSIASRIDCFSEVSTKLFGEKLKEQVEDRLKFYESGDLPKKNVDAMQEAIAAVKEEADAFEEVKHKKKKKDKKASKRKAEEMENEENDSKPANGVTNGVHDSESVEAPKKKKKRVDQEDAPIQNGTETPVSEKKKKKKDKKNSNEDQTEAIVKVETPVTEKKKKKKKKENDS